MRVRAVVAIAVLLLPTQLQAQRRVPGIGRRGPAEPVPLPPQPQSIARAVAYQRLRVSAESYPMITVAQAPNFAGDGRASSWTAFGMGTRLEYRLTPHASATMDLTSSVAGSPLIVQTAEIGTRLRPRVVDFDQRTFPFFDLRAGYISAYDRTLGAATVDPSGFPLPSGIVGARYSSGFGGVAGVGVEYALTHTFFITTAGSVVRSHMTSHDYASTRTVVPSFAMTAYRLTLGVRYNPVRMVMP